MHDLNFLLLPNANYGHIGSEYVADLFSSKLEQRYNSVGFNEDNKHILKIVMTILLFICVCIKMWIMAMVTLVTWH